MAVGSRRSAVSFPRRVGRVCAALLGLHAMLSASLLLYSRLGHDALFEAHWSWSRPVLFGRRLNALQSIWSWLQHQPGLTALSDEESRCVEAWLDLMRLELSTRYARELSPLILVQDSLTTFDGIAELRDGVYVLQHCLHAVRPTLQEVRRESQGDAVLLHCRVALELVARVPFTRRTFTLCELPSVSTLQLERWPTPQSRRIITAAEHRWFGGPIWSHQTGTMRSPWGDVGDLCRRYNGFMLSVLLTRKQDISRRLEPFRLAAAEISAEVGAQQASQMKM